MRWLCGVLLAATLGGCATDRYLFRPTEHANASLPENGFPAALYQVPPERPQGEVKIASLGVQKLEDPPGRHLILRMVVTNNSDEPWSLDTTRQTLTLAGAGGGAIAPVRAYGSTALTGPVLEIPPRQQRTVDLMYPVPRKLKVQNFQVAWSLSTPTTYVTQYSSFRREELPDTYASSYYYGYPYGPYSGWYGPGYFGSSLYWGYPYAYGYGYGWHRGGYPGRPPVGGGGVPSGPRTVPPPPPFGGGYGHGGFGGGGFGGGGFSGGHIATPPPASFGGGGRGVGAPPAFRR
ncbi:MAG TPA: hypothetical protein VH877_09005 [Polyangia bacterium]|nr:hypothetical protein [Polyangia bacterium]